MYKLLNAHIQVRKLAEGNHLDSIAKAISGRVGSKCFLRLYNYERKEEYTVTLERMDPASFGIEEKAPGGLFDC